MQRSVFLCCMFILRCWGLHAEVDNDSIKECQKIVSISFFFQVEKNISSLGHEQDAETGYNARNARWQDADMLGFGQVDPMSDKYPSVSPYNYCMGNPILITDPTGEDPDKDREGERGERVKHSDGNYYIMTEKGWGGTPQEDILINSKKTNIGVSKEMSDLMGLEPKENNKIDYDGIKDVALGTSMELTSLATENGYLRFSSSRAGISPQFYTNWNGNQYTQGIRTGGISNTLTKIGYVMGLKNSHDLYKDYSEGKISQKVHIAEQMTNIFGTIGGLHGAAWSIGWESGRIISQTNFYINNIKTPIQEYMTLKRIEELNNRDLNNCILCPK